jgi:hypothetical protein
MMAFQPWRQVPPPLTPPLKGEGDCGVGIFDSLDAALSSSFKEEVDDADLIPLPLEWRG